MQRSLVQERGSETNVATAVSTVSDVGDAVQKHVTFSDDVQAVHTAATFVAALGLAVRHLALPAIASHVSASPACCAPGCADSTEGS